MTSLASLSLPTLFVEEEITVEISSMKGLTGQWSKWGGARKSVYINQWEKELDSWFCQNCGKEEPKQISPFLYEFPLESKEYIRVCGPCFKEKCFDVDARSKVDGVANPNGSLIVLSYEARPETDSST